VSILITEEIEDTKELLDKLVSEDNPILNEGKILEVSEELDILIAAYYEEGSI
jgi:hypothetical protein